MDVAETLAAMGNADGGELVLGIEDDGAVTGVRQPEDRLSVILSATRSKNYVHPPLPVRSRELRTADGHRLFHFEVDWSPDVHQLAGSRYLLRVNDNNSPLPAEQIAALKSAKTQGLWERNYPPGATLADLDMDLIATLAPAAWAGRNPEELLRDRGLTAGRNGHSVPSNAALLLFGKSPARWHPRCGIDFIRWQGPERKQGAEFNAVKRFAIDGPLTTIVRKAYDAILPLLPERNNLQDLLFNEKLVYPVDQKRILASAHAHADRFTSRDVQELLDTDIYGAATLIKDLIRKGAVRSPSKGSRIYQVIEPLAAKADTPEDLAQLLPLRNRRGHIRNQDLRKELHLTRISATRKLQDWVATGWLLPPKASRGIGAVYPPGPNLLHHPRIASSTPETDAMLPETDAIPASLFASSAPFRGPPPPADFYPPPRKTLPLSPRGPQSRGPLSAFSLSP
jgi:ATP-dependent DNA helicase RecG